jgi:hypothetical protein
MRRDCLDDGTISSIWEPEFASTEQKMAVQGDGRRTMQLSGYGNGLADFPGMREELPRRSPISYLSARVDCFLNDYQQLGVVAGGTFRGSVQI